MLTLTAVEFCTTSRAPDGVPAQYACAWVSLTRVRARVSGLEPRGGEKGVRFWHFGSGSSGNSSSRNHEGGSMARAWRQC